MVASVVRQVGGTLWWIPPKGPTAGTGSTAVQARSPLSEAWGLGWASWTVLLLLKAEMGSAFPQANEQARQVHALQQRLDEVLSRRRARRQMCDLKRGPRVVIAHKVVVCKAGRWLKMVRKMQLRVQQRYAFNETIPMCQTIFVAPARQTGCCYPTAHIFELVISYC